MKNFRLLFKKFSDFMNGIPAFLKEQFNRLSNWYFRHQIEGNHIIVKILSGILTFIVGLPIIVLFLVLMAVVVFIFLIVIILFLLAIPILWIIAIIRSFFEGPSVITFKYEEDDGDDE